MVESGHQTPGEDATKGITSLGAVGAALVALAVTVPLQSYTFAQTGLPDPPPIQRTSLRLSEPRVAPVPEGQWTAEQRAVVDLYDERGDTGNALATLLQVPELAESVHSFLNYTSHDSSLPARDREILILRTAWLAQNASIWSGHAAAAQSVGLTASDLRRIASGPDADGWSRVDATLLRMVDELFVSSSVTDATWDAVSAHYDVPNMVDAVMTVAEFTTLSMVLNSFGVQPDEETTFRLPTDIAYQVVVRPREPPRMRPRIDPIDGPGFRVGRTIARNPQVSETWGGNTNYVNRQSPLVPHDRELLILRIGWNCQAEYEWAKHVGSVGRARDHGLEPRWIAEGPESPRWEPYEVALLMAADELYRDAIVSDETWNELASYYDTHEMMSIVMTVSTYRFVSMTLNAFGVQLLPDDERFPGV